MATTDIPEDFGDFIRGLEGFGSLLNATQWERAAWVASRVRLEHPEEGDKRYQSPKAFAMLKITGLKTAKTVRLVVQAWLDHSEGVYPEPGETVEYPTEEYPTQAETEARHKPVKPIPELVWTVEKSGEIALSETATPEQRRDALIDARRERAERIQRVADLDRAIEVLAASLGEEPEKGEADGE